MHPPAGLTYRRWRVDRWRTRFGQLGPRILLHNSVVATNLLQNTETALLFACNTVVPPVPTSSLIDQARQWNKKCSGTQLLAFKSSTTMGQTLIIDQAITVPRWVHLASTADAHRNLAAAELRLKARRVRGIPTAPHNRCTHCSTPKLQLARDVPTAYQHIQTQPYYGPIQHTPANQIAQ